MSKSFFKQFVLIENLVKSEEPKLMLKDGTYTYYSEDAKNLVTEISNWLLECNFTKSKTNIFICQNYNKSCEGLTNLWNKTNKPKSKRTFQCQISTLSSHLYELLGSDCFDAILRDDKDKIKEIKLRLNLFTEDITFTDYPIEMFQYYVSSEYSGKEYTLEECEEEIFMLKTLRRNALADYMERADSDKLSYLKVLLNKPLFDQHLKKVNQKKLELIKKLDTVNGLSYADIVVNYLKKKGKEEELKEKAFETMLTDKFGIGSNELKVLLDNYGTSKEELESQTQEEVKETETYDSDILSKYDLTEKELIAILEQNKLEKKIFNQYDFMSISEYIKRLSKYRNENHTEETLNNSADDFANELKIFDKDVFDNIISKYTSDAVVQGLHKLRIES